MASARRLAWLTGAFGALAATTALLTAVTVLSRLDFSIPVGRDLMAACRQLLPSFGPAGLAVLAVLVLLTAVLVRGARAVVGLQSAQRRLSRELGVLAVEQRGGVRYHRIAGTTPQAFCVGMVRPRICVSEDAFAALDERELQAVLAHEEHHRRRRDPLRLAIGGVAAQAFFFLPALRRLHERYRAMAELAADEEAVRSTDPSTLASALLRFSPTGPSVAVGIAPERVDHLLGEPPRWDLPLLVLVGSLAVLGLLVAVAAVAAQAAGTVNVPMALMGSCGVLMLAAGAGVAVSAGLLVGRRRA